MAILDDYTRWGFDTRGWSRETRRQYRARLEAFQLWLDKPLRNATGEDALAWLSTLPATPQSRNHARKALTSFGDFLSDSKLRAGNPFAQLPRLRERPGIPKALTLTEAQRLYVASARAGTMWHLAVVLWLTAGLRCRELQRLEWRMIEDGWLRIIGKGGKERMLPLHSDAVELLEAWRRECRDARWVFPSPVLWDAPVSAGWLRTRLRQIAQEAGVEDVHPHRLRHTAATRLLECGADVREVQSYLGHASLATTTIYLRVRPERLARAVSKLDFGGQESLHRAKQLAA